MAVEEKKLKEGGKLKFSFWDGPLQKATVYLDENSKIWKKSLDEVGGHVPWINDEWDQRDAESFAYELAEKGYITDYKVMPGYKIICTIPWGYILILANKEGIEKIELGHK